MKTTPINISSFIKETSDSIEVNTFGFLSNTTAPCYFLVDSINVSVNFVGANNITNQIIEIGKYY